jgi:hypothetical protein
MESTNQTHWRKGRFFFFPLLLLGLFAVSAVVMLLWNSILPAISTLKAITYWQAMGLFVLSRILFGGFRFGRHRRHARQHFARAPFNHKFMEMTEEEKQQFKKQWKQRCC